MKHWVCAVKMCVQQVKYKTCPKLTIKGGVMLANNRGAQRKKNNTRKQGVQRLKVGMRGAKVSHPSPKT